MTKWLASVQSLEEAKALLPILPDILDMKDPSKGALGALSVETVTEIVNMINGKCLTSATIGDLPMQANVISDAMIAMANSGVDYIKIGLFPEANVTECIEALSDTVKNLEKPVISVIFADKSIDLNNIPLLKNCGFSGIMVDTAIKNGHSLLSHWDKSQLIHFVDAVHQHDMLCGLAGALKIENIAELKPLNADYLGFRSALCGQQQRSSSLQLNLVEQLKSELKCSLI